MYEFDVNVSTNACLEMQMLQSSPRIWSSYIVHIPWSSSYKYRFSSHCERFKMARERFSWWANMIASRHAFSSPTLVRLIFLTRKVFQISSAFRKEAYVIRRTLNAISCVEITTPSVTSKENGKWARPMFTEQCKWLNHCKVGRHIGGRQIKTAKKSYWNFSWTKKFLTILECLVQYIY